MNLPFFHKAFILISSTLLAAVSWSTIKIRSKRGYDNIGMEKFSLKFEALYKRQKIRDNELGRAVRVPILRRNIRLAITTLLNDRTLSQLIISPNKHLHVFYRAVGCEHPSRIAFFRMLNSETSKPDHSSADRHVVEAQSAKGTTGKPDIPATAPIHCANSRQGGARVFAGALGEDIGERLHFYYRVSQYNKGDISTELGNVVFYLTDVAKDVALEPRRKNS